MRRKGTLEFLGILLMIAFFINFFSMFLQPSVVYQSLQFATDDLDPRIESGGLSTFLEESFVTRGVNYSLYQTSYDSAAAGADLDYHVNDVPSQQEVRQSLLDDAETAIETAYLDGREGLSRCGLPGDADNFPDIDLSVINHTLVRNQTQGILFETGVSGGPMSVQCETDVTMAHFDIAVKNEIFSIHNRYFKAYNRTRDILRNESLNRFMDDVHQNASRTATVTSCVLRPTDTGCGFIEPDKPYGDTLEEDDYVVRKYEGLAGEELSDYLDDVDAYYNRVFANTSFVVETSVVGVDYRPYDVSSKHHTIRSGNHEDNDDEHDTGGTEGCDDDDDPPTCDDDCSLDDSDPKSGETYSSWCSEDAGMREFDTSFDISTSTTLGTVEEDANPITDDPWTQSSDTDENSDSCNYQVDDPYPDFSINWDSVSTAGSFDAPTPGDVAMMVPELENNIERTRGCSCERTTCTRSLNAELKRRSQYNYSLQTAVEIRVEVMDNRTDFFVNDGSGEEPLTFVTHYTYRNWDDSPNGNTHAETIANWGSAPEIEYEAKTEDLEQGDYCNSEGTCIVQ